MIIQAVFESVKLTGFRLSFKSHGEKAMGFTDEKCFPLADDPSMQVWTDKVVFSLYWSHHFVCRKVVGEHCSVLTYH